MQCLLPKVIQGRNDRFLFPFFELSDDLVGIETGLVRITPGTVFLQAVEQFQKCGISDLGVATAHQSDAVRTDLRLSGPGEKSAYSIGHESSLGAFGDLTLVDRL